MPSLVARLAARARSLPRAAPSDGLPLLKRWTGDGLPTPTLPGSTRPMLAAGVELEFGGPRPRLAAAIVAATLGGRIRDADEGHDAFVVCDRDGQRWKVHQDGPNTEVASPILRDALDCDKLFGVARALRRAGARVDGRTGLHIHRSAVDFDDAAACRLALLMGDVQQELGRRLHVEPSRQHKFCRPLPQSILELCRAPGQPPHRIALGDAFEREPHEAKMYMLNFSNYMYQASTKHTFEFRLFEGTLSPRTIGGYLALTEAMTDAAIEGERLVPAGTWGLERLAQLCERTPLGRDSGIAAQLRTPPLPLLGWDAMEAMPLPALLELAGDPWWRLRERAASSLGVRFGAGAQAHGPARSTLARLMADERDDVAVAAATAIGRARPATHLPGEHEPMGSLRARL